MSEACIILNAQAVLVRVKALQVSHGGTISHYKEKMEEFVPTDEIMIEDVVSDKLLLSNMIFNSELNAKRTNTLRWLDISRISPDFDSSFNDDWSILDEAWDSACSREIEEEW